MKPIILILSIILIVSKSRKVSNRILASPPSASNNSSDVTKDWPCPLAEDILPCTCSNDINGLGILCDNVVELLEIQRIFSQHFPIPNMGKLLLSFII